MNLGTLFGDSDLENMFTRIDGLNNSLSKNIKRSDPDITDAALREMLKVMQGDDTKGSDNVNDTNSLLNKITVSSNRLMRYRTYDEIYKNVSILKRIISVYLSNTLQIDVMTNTALQFKNVEGSTINSESDQYYNQYCKKLAIHFDLESRLKQLILPNMLRYGDHFVEIIDILDDVVDFKSIKTQQMITENKLLDIHQKISDIKNSDLSKNSYSSKVKSQLAIKSLYETFVEVESISINDVDVFESFNDAIFELDQNTGKIKYSNSKSSESDSPKSKTEPTDVTKKSFDENNFKRILLRYHKPSSISVLRTQHGTVLGYAQINIEMAKEVTPGVTAQFAKVINAMGDVNKNNDGNYSIVKGIVNNIISSLISKIKIPTSQNNKAKQKEILAQYEKDILNELGEDLFILAKRLFIEVNPQSMQLNKLKVRFISKDRMVPFCYNPIEYDPYGTSVLDSLVYPAKLYMLTQLSNVVNKLSRASLIRKWTLNKIGALYSNVY